MWWRKRPDLLSELPKFIIAYCVGSETTHQHDLELLKGQLSGIDQRIALGELFALRMAVAVLVAREYIHSRAQAKMRTAFARTFHAFLTESSMEHVADWLIPVLRIVQLSLANARTDPNVFIDYINKRANRYITAYTTPHSSGKPLFAVGEVFSELCGAPGDPGVAIVGVIEFSGALQGGLGALQQCQRLPGGEIINIDPDWKSPLRNP